MQPTTPPPVPKSPRTVMSRRAKILIALATICLGALMALRVCGLVRPFSVPTGAMSPAVSGGDDIIVEGVTFLSRQPRRGDVVVFKTDGVVPLPSPTFYVKRIAGEPGDRVRISTGKLFINEKQVSLSNAVGEIIYDLPPGLSVQTDVTVPSGCFFMLGDNSTNSFDSRFWGSVPRGNIIGRASFCYWPPGRIGGVK
jgi:signal peptidase I